VKEQEARRLERYTTPGIVPLGIQQYVTRLSTTKKNGISITGLNSHCKEDRGEAGKSAALAYFIGASVTIEKSATAVRQKQ
jgi:hypothetical protein